MIVKLKTEENIMIRPILIAAMTLTCATTFAGHAQAKQLPHFSPLSENMEFVTSVADFARTNLKEAKLPNGKKIGRESKKEMKVALLPYDKEQEVVDRGILAITAEWCGIEWQSASFKPYMNDQRASGQWNDKQLAYMGVMHGFTMGMVGRQLNKAGDCTPKHKAAVKNYMAKLR
jgi:hypothetical protein